MPSFSHYTNPHLCNSFKYFTVQTVHRDANFQDAEIVRSEERRGRGPRERPSGVEEQRHFGRPGEICQFHCISDVIDQIYRSDL